MSSLNDQLDTLNQDIAEIQRLKELSQRDSAKGYLRELLDSLSQKRHTLETTVRSTTEQCASNQANYILYRGYGWDETDDNVNIYALNFPKEIDAASVKMEFPSPTEFVAMISNYKIQIRPLNKAIDAEKSSFKVGQKNKNRITFQLKKATSGKWYNLLQNNEHEKFKKVPSPKEDDEAEEAVDNSDPQASLTKLMKKMYDEGDDDMKRTILKSWHEAQNKQKPPLV